MVMQKINWQNEGDKVRLTMPIAKVDVEKRQVSGWASLDNLDQHRDLVDADASRQAFAAFRGNIREMHDEKKAVGRLVNFREDTLYHDGKEYQGIYVTAYVSKGAEDTWQKVLDGTLSGFSIGGNVQDAKNAVDPKTGEPFRRVTKYMLTELSLVDNPANQYANVVSIAKSVDGGMTITGDLADVTIEHVYVCNNCLDKGHGVHKSSTESLVCPICDETMINIGFVESSDPTPRETIKKMVDNHLADREGGVKETMPDENVKNESTEVEEVETPAAEAVAPAVEVTEVEEVKVDVEEVEDPLTAAINELRSLTDRIEQSSEAQTAEVAELTKRLESLDGDFSARLETVTKSLGELQERQDEFSKKFDGVNAEMAEVKKNLTSEVEEVRKGLTDLDASTALRKSVDSDQSAGEEKPKKDNFWAGSFLNSESL